MTQKQKRLRSGIYALFHDSPSTEDEAVTSMVYIIYWPEENTWNDVEEGSVKKNRVAFMRYLTRLADQILALISTTDAESLVYQPLEEETDLDLMLDEDDDPEERYFKFEVAKTRDEEEEVRVSEGFDVR